MEKRQALSARGVEREFGIARTRIVEAIKAGELSASRLGSRRLIILRSDVEEWIRSHAIRPPAKAEQIVRRVLSREIASEPVAGL